MSHAIFSISIRFKLCSSIQRYMCDHITLVWDGARFSTLFDSSEEPTLPVAGVGMLTLDIVSCSWAGLDLFIGHRAHRWFPCVLSGIYFYVMKFGRVPYSGFGRQRGPRTNEWILCKYRLGKGFVWILSSGTWCTMRVADTISV